LKEVVDEVFHYMWCKIISSYTTLSLLEIYVVFLATCFGSYTEPSSERFVHTIGALRVTRCRITNSS